MKGLAPPEVLSAVFEKFRADNGREVLPPESEGDARVWVLHIKNDWQEPYREGHMAYPEALFVRAKGVSWVLAFGGELMEASENYSYWDLVAVRVFPKDLHDPAVKEAVQDAMVSARFFDHSVLMVFADGRFAIHRNSKFLKAMMELLDVKNLGETSITRSSMPPLFYPDLDFFRMRSVSEVRYHKEILDYIYEALQKIFSDPQTYLYKDQRLLQGSVR